jgi:superfamily II DNA/RNA helicase
MVVNYDLPLMTGRGTGGRDEPDIETYIHRIGPYACLHVTACG